MSLVIWVKGEANSAAARHLQRPFDHSFGNGLVILPGRELVTAR